MEGTSIQVRKQVRDTIEQGFDTAHRVADVATFPLAPFDGAVHGVARGVFNWLTDRHPGDEIYKSTAPTGQNGTPPQPTNSYNSSPGYSKAGPNFSNSGSIGSQNNTTGDNNKLDARISGPMNFGNPRG